MFQDLARRMFSIITLNISMLKMHLPNSISYFDTLICNSDQYIFFYKLSEEKSIFFVVITLALGGGGSGCGSGGGRLKIY